MEHPIRKSRSRNERLENTVTQSEAARIDSRQFPTGRTQFTHWVGCVLCSSTFDVLFHPSLTPPSKQTA